MDIAFWILLCFLGVIVHFLKQMMTQRRADGTPLSWKDYWVKYPYETVFAIVGAIAFFIITWRMGMMNDAMAFGCGFAGNSVADVYGARAKAVAGSAPMQAAPQ